MVSRSTLFHGINHRVSFKLLLDDWHWHSSYHALIEGMGVSGTFFVNVFVSKYPFLIFVHSKSQLSRRHVVPSFVEKSEHLTQETLESDGKFRIRRTPEIDMRRYW